MITVPQKVQVRRAELQNLVTEKPVGSSHWYQPIAHSLLIDTLLTEMSKRLWKVSNMSLSLSNDTKKMAASFNLLIPNLNAPAGQAFSLGVLTANDRTRSLKMVVGTNVFVCNNGMATGELVLQKKHSISLDLPGEICNSLDLYLDRAKCVNDMVERMSAYHITDRREEHILMEAGRRGIMPWSRIGEVDKEFRNPTFDEHKDKNSWNLYNAFTHIVKKCPPLNQMTLMNKFRGLLPMAEAAT